MGPLGGVKTGQVRGPTAVDPIPTTAKPSGPSALPKASLVLHDRNLDLDAAWAIDRAPKVSGEQIPKAIDALFAHHANILARPADGLTIHEGVGPGEKLELVHLPNRTKARDASAHKPDGCTCVLCSPPDPDQRGISWRSYTAWPNIFPYLPPESQPTVLSATGHAEQQFSASIMRDMIDYQQFASAKQPVTMFYHHFSGNSERHLHWHATSYSMPVQKRLDSGELPVAVVRADAKGAIETFEDDFFGGFVVRGDRDYVARWATRLVDEAEGDSNAGAYNLMLMPRKNGEVRLLVFLRRLDPRQGEEDRMILGAPEIAGTLVAPSEQIPPALVTDKVVAQDQNVMKPSEAAWIGRIAKLPDSDLIALRASRAAQATST